MIHRFSLLEKVLLAGDVLPHPLLDTALIGTAKALTLAVKVGLCDHLDRTPRAASELAQQSGLSERGVTALCDCLDALGYVRTSSAGYAFSKRGQKFLAKDSPHSFRSMMRFMDFTYASFVDLEQTISTGTPEHTNLDRFSPQQWEDFARAMIELARTNVVEVAKLCAPSASARRLLDLGGCHGIYSAALCAKAPDLSAEVMDFEAVRPYFDEAMARAPGGKQVGFRVGDFTKDDLGTGYDVALAFNIIHGFDHAGNVALARRVFAALNPGGRFIMLDQIKDAAGTTQLAKLTTSFMALNLLHQASGFTYALDEVKSWCGACGFKDVALKKLRAPGFAVIVATR